MVQQLEIHGYAPLSSAEAPVSEHQRKKQERGYAPWNNH